MPLLGYCSDLPLDFWDLTRSLFDAMQGLVLCLTAFLASDSFFLNAPPGSLGVQVASAQYLLGLGQRSVFVGSSLSYAVWQVLGISLGEYLVFLRVGSTTERHKPCRGDKYDGTYFTSH